jgi:hypothetical protein
MDLEDGREYFLRRRLQLLHGKAGKLGRYVPSINLIESPMGARPNPAEAMGQGLQPLALEQNEEG